MKTILTSALFSFFCFITFSQVWIDQEAIWHYDFDAIGGFQGYSKYEYTGDDLIQGHDCQIIESNQHQVYPGPNGTYYHTDVEMETNFTYTNGDTVFWLVEDEFLVLYNFGAQPGDTWVVGQADASLECLDATVLVDSIGTVTLNGENLRWIAFHTLEYSSYLYSGKAVERFGLFEMSYYSPHALFPVKTDCTEGTVIDFSFNQFTCYEDVSFNLLNTTSQDCEYKATLSIQDLNSDKTGISYHINQIDKTLQLDAKELSNTTICHIVNSMGQIVVDKKNLFKTSNSESINVSKLNPGIYFLQISKDGFNQNERFLIQN